MKEAPDQHYTERPARGKVTGRWRFLARALSVLPALAPTESASAVPVRPSQRESEWQVLKPDLEWSIRRSADLYEQYGRCTGPSITAEMWRLVHLHGYSFRVSDQRTSLDGPFTWSYSNLDGRVLRTRVILTRNESVPYQLAYGLWNHYRALDGQGPVPEIGAPGTAERYCVLVFLSGLAGHRKRIHEPGGRFATLNRAYSYGVNLARLCRNAADPEQELLTRLGGIVEVDQSDKPVECVWPQPHRGRMIVDRCAEDSYPPIHGIAHALACWCEPSSQPQPGAKVDALEEWLLDSWQWKAPRIDAFATGWERALADPDRV